MCNEFSMLGEENDFTRWITTHSPRESSVTVSILGHEQPSQTGDTELWIKPWRWEAVSGERAPTRFHLDNSVSVQPSWFRFAKSCLVWTGDTLEVSMTTHCRIPVKWSASTFSFFVTCLILVTCVWFLTCFRVVRKSITAPTSII